MKAQPKMFNSLCQLASQYELSITCIIQFKKKTSDATNPYYASLSNLSINLELDIDINIYIYIQYIQCI